MRYQTREAIDIVLKRKEAKREKALKVEAYKDVMYMDFHRCVYLKEVKFQC